MDNDGEPLTVLYDESCGLCRRLAEYGRVRATGTLEFVSWQEFVTRPEASAYFTETERAAEPDQLRVIDGGAVRDGSAAWEAILAAYPPFESLTWIASRLGLLGALSRATYHGGHWARRRCATCP